MQMQHNMEERKQGEYNSQGFQQFNSLDGLNNQDLLKIVKWCILLGGTWGRLSSRVYTTLERLLSWGETFIL